ncbi:MAG: polyisoprenoid-binding protein [Nitrosomonadales bacterium]|jgi:polyisoprenoid-binding protein YceI|nr:MAG: polyisoprenoid-binding protein [Nitrosomonadales bacterium]
MFHKITTLIVSIFFFFSASVTAATENYIVDPTHTYPHFAVSHLGYSTMHGRFDKTSGKLTIDRAAKVGSVDIIIEADSLNTGMKKRDAHLRSPDFFNTAEFPKVTYKSTAINFNGDTPTTVEGNLTLLGVTKPVTLIISSFKCGKNPMNQKAMCGIDAIAKMKRSDFGMNYALPGVGDNLKLTIEVEAYRN